MFPVLCTSWLLPQHLRERCSWVHTWGHKVDIHSEAAVGYSSLLHVPQICIFGPVKQYGVPHEHAMKMLKTGLRSVKWPFEIHSNIFPWSHSPFSCHLLDEYLRVQLLLQNPNIQNLFPRKYKLLIILPHFLSVYIVAQ